MRTLLNGSWANNITIVMSPLFVTWPDISATRHVTSSFLNPRHQQPRHSLAVSDTERRSSLWQNVINRLSMTSSSRGDGEQDIGLRSYGVTKCHSSLSFGEKSAPAGSELMMRSCPKLNARSCGDLRQEIPPRPGKNLEVFVETSLVDGGEGSPFLKTLASLDSVNVWVDLVQCGPCCCIVLLGSS